MRRETQQAGWDAGTDGRCMVVDVRMVADCTGEHGAGMAGHGDEAAQHVEGGVDGVPARTRAEYDRAGLESLVGFLSMTDSQRRRKADAVTPDKESLARRANAEEWCLRSEVPPVAYVPGTPSPTQPPRTRAPAGQRAGLLAARSARPLCLRSRADGVCPVGRRWRRSNG